MGCSSTTRLGISEIWEAWKARKLVLGKFSPRPIGPWSGLDQTPWSQSRSGIFPKTLDCLVSGLGIPILPEPISDLVWTETT